jgi:hypothetical protein
MLDITAVDRHKTEPDMNILEINERGKAMAARYLPSPLSRPAGTAPDTVRPETNAPYIIEIEADCDECGGSGFDPGGIDPWGPETCPACRGAGTQRITKNYLGEALRIAANPECPLPVERAHLVAIVHYCRQAVSAAVSLPEVPARVRHQPAPKRSFRHRRRRSQSREVSQIARRKTKC